MKVAGTLLPRTTGGNLNVYRSNQPSTGRRFLYSGCVAMIVIGVLNALIVSSRRLLWGQDFGNLPSDPFQVQLGKPFEKSRKYHVEISDSKDNVLPPGFKNAKYKIDKSKSYGLCAIGAGLSGTVFAERAANYLSQRVLVIDSRPHIGGNCYDFVDAQTGILRNQYGSHLFHTDIERVWKYVTSNPKAPKWRRWYHAKFGLVNGDYVPIPVNIQTVNRLLDVDIQTEEEMNEWLKSVQIPCPESGCENAEQMAKSRVGEELYKLIFEGYTVKQWGMDPKLLNASVTARIPVLATFDPRYFEDKYQALPSQGYTAWFAAMLDHPLIDVVLNVDFFDHKDHLEAACEKIVYTGPIDKYFESSGMEKLEYRSIIFTEERHYNHPGYILPTPVLNYPGLETQYTRAVEYKQYLHRPSNHSIVVKEVSSSDGDPYYPVPTARNLQLYGQYQALATELEKTGKIQFVGRLANYKYFNMDQAIDNALTLFYKSSPLRTDFIQNEFRAYKASIDQAMAVYQQEVVHDERDECQSHLWKGEFGKEMRVMIPWAYYIRELCGGVSTSGVAGTKYLYFFSSQHDILENVHRSSEEELPLGNPFESNDVHMKDIPTDRWRAPPYAEFFRRPEMEGVLNGKPLVVILNKYSMEWGGWPKNYFSVETLRKALDYLTPKYTVLYKRHTSAALMDTQGLDGDLNEKSIIRKEYPDVLFFEDFAEALDDIEDSNLLLWGFMSLSKRFLTVQGGTAVTGSYFGGTNIILIKKGKELKYGDYSYFHKFSNATVVQTQTDQSFLAEMKNYM